MKKLKRIAVLLLTVALLFTFAACSGDGDTPSKITAGDDDAANGPYAGIEQYKGSTIKFATWIDHTAGEGAVPMASFAEKYGINVEIATIPQSNYVTKLSGLIASNQSPDMIVDNYQYPGIFPLAEDLSTVRSIDLTDDFWDDAVTERGSVNGKPYLINSLNSPWTYRFMCFYNKSLFEENGWKSPGEFYEEDNWNIDTFVQCATRIASLGEDYIGAYVRQQFAAGIFGTEMITMKDGKFVNNTSDPKLSQAYKWMLQNAEKGIFNMGSSTDKFVKNQVGMFLYGDYGLRTTGGFGTMNPDKIGYAPMPKVSAEDEYYPSVATWRAYGICEGSKNAEATGYFLRYFLDFENYDRDTMFKNSEASEFYDELREIEDKALMLVSNGVLNVDTAQSSGTSIYSTITGSTSAQLDTNLKSISNVIDNYITKANQLLESQANS